MQLALHDPFCRDCLPVNGNCYNVCASSRGAGLGPLAFSTKIRNRLQQLTSIGLEPTYPITGLVAIPSLVKDDFAISV